MAVIPTPAAVANDFLVDVRLFIISTDLLQRERNPVKSQVNP